MIKVLALEDNESDQILISEILEDYKSQDFEVIFAESLKDAKKIVKKDNEIDVVLVDLKVEDSVGISTFYSMKKVCDKKPIIILSGNVDIDVSIEAVKNGAQDYITKGIGDNLFYLPRAILYSIERKKIDLEKEKMKEDKDRFYRRVKQAAREGNLEDIMFDIMEMEVDQVLK